MSTDPDNGRDNGGGFVDGFDESEDFSEDELVTIQDEDGNEVQCAIVAVLVHEGAQYVVMQPVDQLSTDDEDEDDDEDDSDEADTAIDTYVFLYEVDEEGLPTFSTIEDDATFDAVCQLFAEV